jgi:hypothetical protein
MEENFVVVHMTRHRQTEECRMAGCGNPAGLKQGIEHRTGRRLSVWMAVEDLLENEVAAAATCVRSGGGHGAYSQPRSTPRSDIPPVVCSPWEYKDSPCHLWETGNAWSKPGPCCKQCLAC